MGNGDTFKLYGSFRSGPNHSHPRKPQETDANNGSGTSNHSQTEKNRRYQEIVQIEETEVMPKSLSEEGGDAFEIERLFLPDAKKYCGGAKMLTIEDFAFRASDVVFGALGDAGLDGGKDVVSAAAFPGIFHSG